MTGKRKGHATMANDEKRRVSHYVPGVVADRFDQNAARYPMLEKQVFFEMVLQVGMSAINADPQTYLSQALMQRMEIGEESQNEG